MTTYTFSEVATNSIDSRETTTTMIMSGTIIVPITSLIDTITTIVNESMTSSTATTTSGRDNGT